MGVASKFFGHLLMQLPSSSCQQPLPIQLEGTVPQTLNNLRASGIRNLSVRVHSQGQGVSPLEGVKSPG